MFGHRYYHETTRRYVAVFGTLFNDIVIERKDNNGDVIQQMKVPISYGPRQKFLARLEGDPDLDRPSAITLPRMSFEITGMAYDGERKIGMSNRKNRADVNDNAALYSQFAPSPYNLDFELNIMTKYAEDGTKILEQIIPFFQPAWVSSMNIVDDMDETVDVPIILNNVTTEDVYEGDFETRRSLLWTLSFTLKGYYYGPISKKKIIKFAKTNIYGSLTSNTDIESITVQPGLNANGEPVTSKSGIQATAEASFGNGILTNITVINDGSNYRSANVTISDPITYQATANGATIVDGEVTSVNNVISGGGYYVTPPSVRFSEPTTNAYAGELTVTVANGSIDSVTVANGGIYYIGTESVTVQSPGFEIDSFTTDNFLYGSRSYALSGSYSNTVYNTGSNVVNGKVSFSTYIPTTFNIDVADIATANSSVANGSVTSLSIVSGGARYLETPTVTINSPDTPRQTTIASSVLTANGVGFVSVEDGGTYYTTAPVITIAAPTANVQQETANVSVSISDGKVSSVTIEDGGELYTSSPTITVTSPTANHATATASATLSGDTVDSITVTDGGRYYDLAPTVTISASPSGNTATATATIDNGEVTAITITSAGSGYTSAPTVTIAGPIVYDTSSANTFSANVSMAADNSYYILDGEDRDGEIVGDTDDNGDVIIGNEGVSIIEGDTIEFNITDTGHPFYILTGVPANVYDIDANTYASGVTNQGATSGTVTFTPDYGYNGTYVYQCGNHVAMYGYIYVDEAQKLSGEKQNHRAILTPTITNGSISSLSIANTGIGYEETPTVEVAAPTGTLSDFTATANATVTDGVVTSITVTDPGYYYESAPDVTVEGPTGSPLDFAATAEVTLSGDSVDSITLTDGGLFYTTEPTVTISAPTKTKIAEFANGTMFVFVDNSKQLGLYDSTSMLETTITGDISGDWTHVSIQTPSDESVTYLQVNELSDSINTTPTFLYETTEGFKLVNSTNTDGFVDELVVTTNLTTFSNTIPSNTHVSDANTVLYVDFEDFPNATQAQISISVADGKIVSASIVDPGSGYTFIPTVTVDDPDGTNETFAAYGTGVLTEGAVTAIDINYGGLGYIEEPTVTILAPLSITAEASAIIDSRGNIDDITITNVGAGYTSTPTVTISAPDNLSIDYADINFDDDWGYVVTIEDE